MLTILQRRQKVARARRNESEGEGVAETRVTLDESRTSEEEGPQDELKGVRPLIADKRVKGE